MGNIASIYRRKKIACDLFLRTAQEVNERRFGGVFDLIPVLSEGLEIQIEEDCWFEYWHTKPGCYAGKHPHGYGEVAHWVKLVFDNEIALALGCKLRDEGVQGSWEPDVTKYPTLWSWVGSMATVDSYKTALRKIEWPRVPEKLKPFVGVWPTCVFCGLEVDRDPVSRPLWYHVESGRICCGSSASATTLPVDVVRSTEHIAEPLNAAK